MKKSLGSFVGRNLHPRLRAEHTELEHALRAAGAIDKLASDAAAATERAASDLAAGNITQKRASDVRKAEAERYLEQAMTGELARLVERAQGAAREVVLQQRQALAKIEAGVGAFEATRATQAADLLLHEATDAMRTEFYTAVRNGDREAVLAGCALPSWGPHAAIGKLARRKLLESAHGAASLDRDRRVELGALIVGEWYADLLDTLESIADSGKEAPEMDPRALLERANDADRIKWLGEAVALGVVEPPSESIAEPSSGKPDNAPQALPRDTRNPRAMIERANQVR